jgi:hypothetical protein
VSPHWGLFTGWQLHTATGERCDSGALVVPGLVVHVRFSPAIDSCRLLTSVATLLLYPEFFGSIWLLASAAIYILAWLLAQHNAASWCLLMGVECAHERDIRDIQANVQHIIVGKQARPNSWMHLAELLAVLQRRQGPCMLMYVCK